MSQKNENKNIVYRRINGRIVPIAVGVAALGSGIALNTNKVRGKIDKFDSDFALRVAAGKKGQRILKFNAGNQAIEKLNSRYNKLLSKADKIKNGDLFGGGNVLKFDPLVNDPNRGMPFAHLKSGDVVHQIRTNVRNLPLMLHELGHKQQRHGKTVIKNQFDFAHDNIVKHINSFYKAKNSKYLPWKDPNYIKNPQIDNVIRSIKHYPKVYSQMAYHKTAMNIYSKILDFKRMAIELEADYKAIKMAKEIRGNNFAKITAKSMIPNVTSYSKMYFLKNAATALAIGGAASLLYGLFKKEKYEKIK